MSELAASPAAPRRRRRLSLRPNLVIGTCLIALMIAAALLSLVWTPTPLGTMDMMSRLAGPSAAHWLGADHFGRDVLTLLLVGARNSLGIAFAAVLLGGAVGVFLGLFAAARRGWAEEVIMRFADFAFAFPAVLAAIIVTALLGVGSTTTVIAIAVANVPVFIRLSRATGVDIWSRDFILAARSAGRGPLHITVRHVLPNASGVLLVQATTQLALAIVIEAGLSYLGLGLQPPAPSWGKMLNDAQTHMGSQPLLAIFPGLAIAIAVLGFNLLGDGLRDLLDPRLRRTR
ncbi:MAG: ABC transporter permease [Azospirillaceae bacterium]